MWLKSVSVEEFIGNIKFEDDKMKKIVIFRRKFLKICEEGSLVPYCENMRFRGN